MHKHSCTDQEKVSERRVQKRKFTHTDISGIGATDRFFQ